MNLRFWRRHRENKCSDQRKQQIQQILITKHSRNLGHNKKKPNLRIIGIEEGEELQIKGPENIFNKIIEENFPNIKNDIPMKVQEAYRTPNRLDQKKKKHPLAI